MGRSSEVTLTGAVSTTPLYNIKGGTMGCVAAKYNIIVYEGGTFDQTFIWKVGTPAVVVNLTGYTAQFKLSAKIDDTVALVTCNTGIIPWAADAVSGVYIDAPTTGAFRLYLNDTNTSGIVLKDTEGVYDLFLYNAGGESVLKLYGRAFIRAAVVR